MNREYKNWKDIYGYYYKRGLSSYIVESLSRILIALLISLAPILLFGCLRYSRIPDRNSIDIEYRFSISFANGWNGIGFFWRMAVVSFLLFTLYKIVKFAIKVPKMNKLHRYFVETLGITDDELGRMKWPLVVESISVNDPILDAPKLTIAQTILRKENYMTGILSDPSILTWKMPPSAGRVSPIPMSRWFCKFLMLSITGVLIDPKGCSIVSIQPLTQTPKMLSSLKLRFRLLGVLLLVFSPVLFAFEIMYLVYYYLNRFRRMWVNFSFREWTPYYKWILREYNELPHLFKARMAESYGWTNKYLGISTLPFVKLLAKVVEFASAFFIVVACVLCFVTDVTFILNTSVGGKSIAWFTLLALISYFIAHSVASTGANDVNADVAISEIEKIVHYDFRDESLGIIPYDEQGAHNAVSPTVIKTPRGYEMNIILRSNVTSEKYPDGVFHAHPEFHSIKKESIGLIEAQGLFILPGRLEKERRVRVVTSDGAEQLIILGHGTLRVSSRMFRREMEATEREIAEIIAAHNAKRG